MEEISSKQQNRSWQCFSSLPLAHLSERGSSSNWFQKVCDPFKNSNGGKVYPKKNTFKFRYLSIIGVHILKFYFLLNKKVEGGFRRLLTPSNPFRLPPSTKIPISSGPSPLWFFTTFKICTPIIDMYPNSICKIPHSWNLEFFALISTIKLFKFYQV